MSDITPLHPEVFSFLQNRRSVPAKAMTGPGPDENEIEELIKIASRVPDHGKIAPWRFIRYSSQYCARLNKQIVERFKALNPDANEEELAIEQNRMSRVPVVIGIISAPVSHPKVPVWEQQLSAGASAMTLLIAANALGYDAQWLSEWYAFDETLGESFGAKGDEQITGFIHIGTRTMPKTQRARPALEDIYQVMD